MEDKELQVLVVKLLDEIKLLRLAAERSRRRPGRELAFVFVLALLFTAAATLSDAVKVRLEGNFHSEYPVQYIEY